MRLISSPLQSFTDFPFRNGIHKYFGGIDTYYAPYIRLNGKFVIKPNYQRDLEPKNNKVHHLVPQIMTCSEEEFLFVIEYVQSLGYKELNWNLGCPYPMVINRGMGSGLIADPDKIDRILDTVHTKTDITISMKMRMGYNDSSEILKVFPVLNKYPIQNVAIHARIGKQLYKGGVDLESFSKCIDPSKHPIFYNGDITTLDSFNKTQNTFPQLNTFLIGRGLISDPFLPSMIKANTNEYPEDRFELFRMFHDDLYEYYKEKLSGAKATVQKMYHFWEYFALSMESPERDLKKIKKAKTYPDFVDAVDRLLDNQMELDFIDDY